MEEGDLEARAKQLRTARLMLWAALIGGLIMIFAMVTDRAGVFITFMLLSWLGGLSGVRDVARAVGTPPLLMYPALVVAFAPVVNLLPIAYYLVRAHAALRDPGGFPEEPVSAALPARPPASRAAAAQERPPGIRGAIACVKSASLGRTGTTPIADGESLKVKVPSASGMMEEDLPVTRATHGVFAVCYLVDEGSQYSYLNQGQLKASGMTLDALHRLAVANLAALVGGKPGLSMHPQEGFNGLTMGGQFEASLVLVDELWDRTLAKHFPNGPVVAIPARDICAFCDAKSAEGIVQLRAVAARVTSGGDHLLSPRLFIRKQGKWQERGAQDS